MTAEMLNVLVSVATLVVVAAAAAAALIQLRHLRTSNQLAALLEIMNQWNLPAVQDALRELKQMPGKMADPEYVTMLRTQASPDRASHPEFLALDLWEQIGTFTKHGLIEENILLDIASTQVGSAWGLAQPAIAALRERSGPATFENFEYLAVRANLWEKRYPDGSYPAGLPRFADLET
ncbi:MAG: hypothetical protein WB615_12640 [Candidatus Tumulicola sp.]